MFFPKTKQRFLLQHETCRIKGGSNHHGHMAATHQTAQIGEQLSQAGHISSLVHEIYQNMALNSGYSMLSYSDANTNVKKLGNISIPAVFGLEIYDHFLILVCRSQIVLWFNWPPTLLIQYTSSNASVIRLQHWAVFKIPLSFHWILVENGSFRF